MSKASKKVSNQEKQKDPHDLGQVVCYRMMITDTIHIYMDLASVLILQILSS